MIIGRRHLHLETPAEVERKFSILVVLNTFPDVHQRVGRISDVQTRTCILESREGGNWGNITPRNTNRKRIPPTDIYKLSTGEVEEFKKSLSLPTFLTTYISYSRHGESNQGSQRVHREYPRFQTCRLLYLSRDDLQNHRVSAGYARGT